MPLVTKIDTGYVAITCNDSGSTFDASGLKTFSITGGPYGQLENRKGGNLTFNPALTQLDALDMYIGTTTFPMSQIAKITNSTFRGYDVALDCSNITDITGSNILFYSNASASFSAITTITNVNADRYFQAEGGSTLSFPNATSL